MSRIFFFFSKTKLWNSKEWKNMFVSLEEFFFSSRYTLPWWIFGSSLKVLFNPTEDLISFIISSLSLSLSFSFFLFLFFSFSFFLFLFFPKPSCSYSPFSISLSNSLPNSSYSPLSLSSSLPLYLSTSLIYLSLSLSSFLSFSLPLVVFSFLQHLGCPRQKRGFCSIKVNRTHSS